MGLLVIVVPLTLSTTLSSRPAATVLASIVIVDISAIVLTGGKMPHERVLNIIKRAHIPLILVKEDSFTIATKINNMIFKIGHKESDKIEKIQSIFEKYVDVDFIYENLN